MDEEILQQIRQIVGEHYHNWAFVVEDIEGEFYYDHSTPLVGKALMQHAVDLIDKAVRLESSSEIVWDDDFDVEDY